MEDSSESNSQLTETVTRLLGDVQRGDGAALEKLFPLVYGELRAIAARQRRNWNGDFTLNTTAVVHEAYLKLAGGQQFNAGSRAHFFAVAATAMRHILCNYARDRRRGKRGGGQQRIDLDGLPPAAEATVFSDRHAAALTGLDEALKRLEKIDARQSRIVECRFFGGLTIEETAAAIGASPATVKREWAMARARLYRDLQPLMEA